MRTAGREQGILSVPPPNIFIKPGKEMDGLPPRVMEVPVTVLRGRKNPETGGANT
jgi:hypothetical protein